MIHNNEEALYSLQIFTHCIVSVVQWSCQAVCRLWGCFPVLLCFSLLQGGWWWCKFTTDAHHSPTLVKGNCPLSLLVRLVTTRLYRNEAIQRCSMKLPSCLPTPGLFPCAPLFLPSARYFFLYYKILNLVCCETCNMMELFDEILHLGGQST